MYLSKNCEIDTDSFEQYLLCEFTEIIISYNYIYIIIVYNNTYNCL